MEVRCHPMPNPQNHFFWGQVEMGSFDEAAQLIHMLRAKMATGAVELNMVDWAKEEFIPKQQNRNGRRKDKSPPSDKVKGSFSSRYFVNFSLGKFLCPTKILTHFLSPILKASRCLLPFSRDEGPKSTSKLGFACCPAHGG